MPAPPPPRPVFRMGPRTVASAKKLLAAVRRRHGDERGLGSLQTVMILAIAATSLLLVKHYWAWWKDFFNLAWEILLEN